MITTIAAGLAGFFFESRIGQGLLIAVLCAGVVTWFALEQRQAGASEVVTEINQKAEKISEKARKAREPAQRPGAAQRLRERHCRDC